jgi:hypothetical protein
MRTCRSTLLALSACAALTASCAPTPLISQDALPPQRSLPLTATESCALFIATGVGLSPRDAPSAPMSLADLEVGYNERGRLLVECDRQRGLAVRIHEGEHADEAAWAAEKARRRKPRWKVW